MRIQPVEWFRSRWLMRKCPKWIRPYGHSSLVKHELTVERFRKAVQALEERGDEGDGLR